MTIPAARKRSSKPRTGTAYKSSANHTEHSNTNGTTGYMSDPLMWPQAPGALLLALEARAPYELATTFAAMPILNKAPLGDGHSVIVFPGLAAGDSSTVPLRKYLQGLGYDVHGWGLGQNRGPRDGVIESAKALVEKIAKQNATPKEQLNKVSLIGWSLGGIYARELAKELPHLVRCVITMGTPFSGHPKSTNAWRVFEYASGINVDQDRELTAGLKNAPPVPTTSIYSRTDGIVAWEASVQDAGLGNGGQTENIEVIASHLGIGMNPTTWWAVADRLSQPLGRWKPFEPTGFAQALFRGPGQTWLPFGPI